MYLKYQLLVAQVFYISGISNSQSSLYDSEGDPSLGKTYLWILAAKLEAHFIQRIVVPHHTTHSTPQVSARPNIAVC
jgi:hypothetical protein